jgi:hypothetical protein
LDFATLEFFIAGKIIADSAAARFPATAGDGPGSTGLTSGLIEFRADASF